MSKQRLTAVLSALLLLLTLVGLLYGLEVELGRAAITAPGLAGTTTAPLPSPPKALSGSLQIVLQWLLFLFGVLCLLTASTMIIQYNLYVIRVPHSRFAPIATVALIASVCFLALVVWW